MKIFFFKKNPLTFKIIPKSPLLPLILYLFLFLSTRKGVRSFCCCTLVNDDEGFIILAVVALFISGAGIRTLSGSSVLSRSSCCLCFSLRLATRSSMSEYFDSKRDMTFWFCVAAFFSTAVVPPATTGVFSLSFNVSSAMLFLLYKKCFVVYR